MKPSADSYSPYSSRCQRKNLGVRKYGHRRCEIMECYKRNTFDFSGWRLVQVRCRYLHWTEARAEMTQKRRLRRNLQATDFVLPRVHFQDRFHHIVDMAL